MRTIITAVSVVAILLAGLIAAAGPGTRFGWWDYGFGLTLIRQAALPVMIGAGVSAIALIAAIIKARGLVPLALIATVFAAGAAFVPIKMKELASSNPFIHDITTDFDNPPAIVEGAKYDRKNPPAYAGGEPAPRSDVTTAEAQREAFPDIQPMLVNRSMDETAELARDVIRSMKMDILADAPSGGQWTIESTYQSTWFGFIDDFVVRLTPEGSKTRVDIRSKSRVGVSDLGANAARIRDFMARLEAASA